MDDLYTNEIDIYGYPVTLIIFFILQTLTKAKLNKVYFDYYDFFRPQHRPRQIYKFFNILIILLFFRAQHRARQRSFLLK